MGKAPRSPWRPEGSEGSAFGQEHKGDRGRAGGGETTGNAPGLQMASGCWAPRCLPLGWICHQPRAPSTVPGSLLPAPCPHHQPHIPITTPNPCPPGEHLVRDRTGAQSSHPLRDFPSCSPRAVSPPSPLPVTSGPRSQRGQFLRLSQPPDQAGQQHQEPAGRTPAVLHAPQPLSQKGRFGREGRIWGGTSRSCVPVCLLPRFYPIQDFRQALLVSPNKRLTGE